MTERIAFATRQRAIQAAQGRVPFDRLLTGGTVVDVATMEVREADIGIVGEMIASVHPRGAFANAHATQDVTGLMLSPGFIDAHVHFESSHMLPHHYASVVVPQGTTSIFCDPHELANVLGLEGVRWAVAATRNLPLRFIVQASSCVPAAPGLEASGADFKADAISDMLSWPDVAGLAEVMDMRAVLDGSARMHAILEAAHASGKLIEGHARGLEGPALQAYLAAGIRGDHEITSATDAIEKLRAGLTVELRGSHDYVLPDAIAAINALPVIPASLTVCTDDVYPDHLVEKGGISDVLRRLIRYGLDPLQAIRCATINTAMHLRRDDLGLVAAGRRADLVALADLREMRVEQVWANGAPVAAHGRLLAPVKPSAAPPAIDTMRLPAFTADDFRIKVAGVAQGQARLRSIRGARFTSWSEIDVAVENGFAVVPSNASLMSVVHRHGRGDPTPQMAIIEGWERWRGAYASTYSHDSHNLTVFGAEPADMALAANAVRDMGGGIAVVRGGAVTARIAYPIAGLLSDRPPAEVAAAHHAVMQAAGEICDWQPPYRTYKSLEGQSLACNPGPHLTDLGLTDGGSKEIRGMVVNVG